jgi:hypothetical protein
MRNLLTITTLPIYPSTRYTRGGGQFYSVQTIIGLHAQTSQNIYCALGPLCYMYKIKSVFHLNRLTAQLSYEGRAAVAGAK